MGLGSMPLDFRAFKREIEKEGYGVQVTAKGHFWVLTPDGGKLVTFAVSHRKSSRGEVYDSYVIKVRKAILQHKVGL